MITTILEEHLGRLKSMGFDTSTHVQPDNWTCVIIKCYPLPSGFSRDSSELLIRVPPLYPNGALDMFWLEESIRLASGALPANTSIESYVGRSWLRFSWHPQNWDPAHSSLLTYLAFIDVRLAMRN